MISSHHPLQSQSRPTESADVDHLNRWIETCCWDFKKNDEDLNDVSWDSQLTVHMSLWLCLTDLLYKQVQCDVRQTSGGFETRNTESGSLSLETEETWNSMGEKKSSGAKSGNAIE